MAEDIQGDNVTIATLFPGAAADVYDLYEALQGSFVGNVPRPRASSEQRAFERITPTVMGFVWTAAAMGAYVSNPSYAGVVRRDHVVEGLRRIRAGFQHPALNRIYEAHALALELAFVGNANGGEISQAMISATNGKLPALAAELAGFCLGKLNALDEAEAAA